MRINSQGWSLLFSVGTMVTIFLILDKEKRRKKYKSISSQEREELIFNKMKDNVIRVGSVVPNRNNDSAEIYELIHIANCFQELR